MTAKQFFKSTAFKCVITLFAILLVCGVFLTVANGFLYVSDEERLDRAINKIYGHKVDKTEIDLSGKTTAFDYSTVTEAYKITDDGNLLVKAEGKEGFGGNVSCWVVVTVEGEGANAKVGGVKKVAIEKAAGESYISKISQSALDELAAKAVYGKELEGGFKHGAQDKGDDYIATGASYSMRAISNCVNGAMEFTALYLEAQNEQV